MKVRDSGMPERDFWETLFDIPTILDRLGVNGTVRSAVELGCGYGTFTIPTAKRITGRLYAFDIEPAMIAATDSRATAEDVKNVELRHRDVVGDGFGLPVASVDAVLLFNILHGENPVGLLRASAALLAPGGRILAIHWRSDLATPRGPELSIRPRPEQIQMWAQETGLLDANFEAMIFPPWHFGLSIARLSPTAK